MGEEKRKPGRPRKWASDAERMRATRAAQRAEREAASLQEGKESRDADRRWGEAPVTVVSPVASTNHPPSVVAPEPIADHKDCQATIRALRTELVNLEERHDDLVLSRWILGQEYELALGRMRSHDPAGIVWLSDGLGLDFVRKGLEELHIGGHWQQEFAGDVVLMQVGAFVEQLQWPPRRLLRVRPATALG